MREHVPGGRSGRAIRKWHGIRRSRSQGGKLGYLRPLQEGGAVPAADGPGVHVVAGMDEVVALFLDLGTERLRLLEAAGNAAAGTPCT